MQKDVYTVKDIAEQLQVQEKAVRNLIASGKVKATKICGKWVVSAESFQQLIDSGCHERENGGQFHENRCSM